MSSPDRRWSCLMEVVMIVSIVNADSSAEYLQKAMIDLQQFNVPASYSAKEHDQYNYPLAATQQQKGEQQQQQQIQRRTGLQNNLFGGTSNVERIVLTPEDLAKMYRSALTSGTAISASSLRDALSSGSGVRLKGNHVEFMLEREEEHRHRKPVYRYYFFPLETFASGFSRDQPHKSILQQQKQQQQQQQQPSTSTDVQSSMEQSGQKELANPLFLAISSFVGMALLFMTGVLFLPKLGKLGGFEGRFFQDDFLRLTSAVLNASEQQPKTEIANRRRWSGYVKEQERQADERPPMPYSNRTRKSRSRRDTRHVNSQGQ